MRKIFLFLSVLLSTIAINAQVLEPVKWSSKIEPKSDNKYVVVFSAAIDETWHMYSQFTPDGGPLAMELKFKNQNGNYKLLGKATESKTKTSYNDIFEVNETYFEKKAVITQEIEVTNPAAKTIDVSISYQVCKEVCINGEKKFSIAIPASNKTANQEAETAKVDETKDANAQNTADTVVVASENKAVSEDNVATSTENVSSANTAVEAEKTEEQSLFAIFFIAFLSGFAALLTPCVFPMIPMTVSFFTKQSKNKATGLRNAIFYGVSIIVIYVGLGSVVSLIFGADALNALSTNVWFNVFFFILLVVFAASFLGAFEIMLPNSWANKVDSQADRGGVIGILFMALALAIVSFSCTGPIVGNLLVVAASQGGIAPIIGMLGFSMALALPFMLFAMFPGWLNSLPKSGGWLNTVKVFLGFLELALAFKFLSNADLVLQLHLLEREVFLAIWIAIFGTLALYLFGKITLPHDSPVTSISVGRLSIALVILSFTVYLIPGLWGAPLKLINAFPPPLEYSESPRGLGNDANFTAETKTNLPKGAKYGPHQIMIFEDYEEGLAYAKEVNKPIMLDFTGFACVNCRKMENNVWSDPTVLPILKNDVVLISLFVDDKREMPLEQQIVSPHTGEKLETYGDKWTDFMISKYKTNTQPLYVLTDLEGNSINTQKPTISYVSTKEFLDWLNQGIQNFKK